VKLWAISDLHLASEVNRAALARLAPHPDDWLIVAGDVGETAGHLRLAWRELSRRFARLLWVPGNHELWTVASDGEGLRGDAKYRHLVDLCREFGVLTPEDPFAVWPGAQPGGSPPCRIALLFTLYDYSFRPPEVPAEGAVAWAAQTRVVCADELLLHPDPYPTRAAWCAERVRYSEARLAAAATEGPLILVDHYPLRYDLLTLRRIPRFSLWCGTARTEEWHRRFGAVAAVHGHLHVRATHRRDGVRFEEVSLGYPRDWRAADGIEPYLRQILPPPEAAEPSC
jgi:3',5'-cyclic AMP phosphodiesterase CpdA